MEDKKQVRWWIPVLTVAVLIGLFYGIGVWYYTRHFFPHTTIIDVDVGGRTITYAHTIVPDLSQLTFSVCYGNTVEEFSGGEINYHYDVLDPNGTDKINLFLNNQKSWLWPVRIFTNSADYSLSTSYDSSLLAELVSALGCVHPEEKVEPQDAYYTYADGCYEIVPEVNANYVSYDSAFTLIQNALDQGKNSVSLDELFAVPAIRANDAELIRIVSVVNSYLDLEIEVTAEHQDAVLDRDTIQSFLVLNEDGTIALDENGDVQFDEGAVYSWVNKHVSGPNYTVGSERTVYSPASGTITVSGGTYGTWVNVPDTTDLVMEALTSCTSGTIEAVYRLTEDTTVNGGVGYTFIDINLDEQKVSLIEDGAVTFSTDCVSGKVSAGNASPEGTYYIPWKTRDWYMEENDVTVSYWLPYDVGVGIGLHDATWRSSFGGSIYEYNGSHGCINLPYSAAKYLYNHVDVGTPVVVHGGETIDDIKRSTSKTEEENEVDVDISEEIEADSEGDDDPESNETNEDDQSNMEISSPEDTDKDMEDAAVSGEQTNSEQE